MTRLHGVADPSPTHESLDCFFYKVLLQFTLKFQIECQSFVCQAYLFAKSRHLKILSLIQIILNITT